MRPRRDGLHTEAAFLFLCHATYQMVAWTFLPTLEAAHRTTETCLVVQSALTAITLSYLWICKGQNLTTWSLRRQSAERTSNTKPCQAAPLRPSLTSIATFLSRRAKWALSIALREQCRLLREKNSFYYIRVTFQERAIALCFLVLIWLMYCSSLDYVEVNT